MGRRGQSDRTVALDTLGADSKKYKDVRLRRLVAAMEAAAAASSAAQVVARNLSLVVRSYFPEYSGDRFWIARNYADSSKRELMRALGSIQGALDVLNALEAPEPPKRKRRSRRKRQR